MSGVEVIGSDAEIFSLSELAEIEISKVDSSNSPHLRFESGKLHLHGGDGVPLTLDLDFTSSANTHMREKTLGKKQPMLRAVGVDAGTELVYDFTAGFGGDSFKFASMGLSVVAFEQNPLVFTFLKFSLENAKGSDAELDAILSRIDLKFGNPIEILSKTVDNSCVYVDPMFPAKKKGALSGKEMQLLHEILGEVSDDENKKLVQHAFDIGAKRVVAKRPLKAHSLGGFLNHSFEGKSVRYDLHIPSQSPASGIE